MTVAKNERRINFIEGQRAKIAPDPFAIFNFCRRMENAANRTDSIFAKLQRNGQGFEEGHSRRDKRPGETN